MTGESKSSLTTFMGKLNLLPILGFDIPRLFPILFAVILLSKLLNMHGKVLSWLGMAPESDFKGDKWKDNVQTGRKIIYKSALMV